MSKSPEELFPELIGKTVDEARKIAEKEGCIIRVVKKDGTHLIMTLAFQFRRINVSTVSGIIVADGMNIG